MILIVHGPPASGKTTLAIELSRNLSIPHISSDNISEWLLDAVSGIDPTTKKNIPSAGYELMFSFARELSKGKGDFIIEGCLNPEGAGERLNNSIHFDHHEIYELFLSAPYKVLVERYEKRAATGKRHLAHNDNPERVATLADHLTKIEYRPLGIGKDTLSLDTTDIQTNLTSKAMEKIKRWKLLEKKN